MSYDDLCILSKSRFWMYIKPQIQFHFILNYVLVMVEYNKDIVYYLLDYIFEIKNSSIVEII